MGNRAYLTLLRGDGEPVPLFEANNLVPPFWLALAGPDDLAPWVERTRAAEQDGIGQSTGLVLTLPWPAARARLREAVGSAPARVPGWAARFAAWAGALERECESLRAEAIELDLAEGENFHSQAMHYGTAIEGLIALWEGDRVPRPPELARDEDTHGYPGDPAIRFASLGWPRAVLLPPKPPPDAAARAKRRRSLREWAWVAVISAGVIGTFALTRSTAASLAVFVAFGVVFWAVELRG